MRTVLPVVAVTAALFLLLGSAPVRGAGDGLDPMKQWGRWRGPLGTGVAPHGDPPGDWSETKNVKWKLALPGMGHASPVVWGDVIIVHTAVKTDKAGEGAKEAPAPGGRRMPVVRTNKVHEFVVLAVDRKNGKILWRTTVCKEVPRDPMYATGSWASHSPITDGEHVYSYFGSRGLHCLTLDGKIVWRKDLGRMKKFMDFGEGSTPALHGNTIVVVRDHQGQSTLEAFDKRTGEEIWSVDRAEGSNWSTPLIVEMEYYTQVITSGARRIRSNDLKTGKLIWETGGMTPGPIPVPMAADGVAYLMSGYRGAAMMAIQLPESAGNMFTQENILWTHRKNTPYVPSGCLHKGHLYFLRSNNAILSCHDAKTGKAHYAGERFQGMGTVYSSIVAAKQRVYVLSRNGQALVIAHGSSAVVLARNTLEDSFSASPAIVGKEMILRGEKNLYCLAED
ncbi:MAG: outer membrane protein assembly factor BamB family protein [Planctomycetota bacterium]|jgi:outer membrane protein assembly factor BamB